MIFHIFHSSAGRTLIVVSHGSILLRSGGVTVAIGRKPIQTQIAAMFTPGDYFSPEMEMERSQDGLYYCYGTE